MSGLCWPSERFCSPLSNERGLHGDARGTTFCFRPLVTRMSQFLNFSLSLTPRPPPALSFRRPDGVVSFLLDASAVGRKCLGRRDSCVGRGRLLALSQHRETLLAFAPAVKASLYVYER